MGAEVDNIPPLNEWYTLCPRVNLGEFLFAVRAQRREILPFDDRERFVTHLLSPPWLPLLILLSVSQIIQSRPPHDTAE